jgi:hypothetical protein
VLAALLVHHSRSTPVLLEDPVTVKRALSTTAALFGDPVEAEIDVYSNDRNVPPGSVRVQTDFRPYRIVATDVDRSSQGGISLLRTRISLRCLTRTCLPPPGGARLVQFPPFAVTYRRDGQQARLDVPWAALQLSSRIPAGAGGRLGIVDTAPPLDPLFSRSPELLQALLLLGAALLGIAGAGLVVAAVWPPSYRSLRRRQRLSELERTLMRVEAAARSDDGDERRRTLDELAIRLGEIPAPALEVETRALAWGQSPPEPEALTHLAAQVRANLNGGVRA